MHKNSFLREGGGGGYSGGETGSRRSSKGNHIRGLACGTEESGMTDFVWSEYD